MKYQTERLYYDFFQTPFEAEILELRPMEDGNTMVFLDKTIFYPEGGGQPGDRGSVNGIQLLDVLEKDGEIIHMVKNVESLKPGPAELILDTRRRRDLTQLHTGQHLLSAAILRMTGAPTVSMHIGDETCTIDVDTPEMSDETLIAVEDAVANAIEENHPVIVHLCPPEDVSSFPLRKIPPKGEETLRIVEIEGNDFIACCGTHLKSTAEIGLLRVLAAEKYKGMSRISFLAGRRLLLDSRILRQNAVTVSRALSIPLGKTGKGVLEFVEKAAQAEKRLKAFEEKAIQEKAARLLEKAAAMPKGTIVIESYAEESIEEITGIAKTAQKQTQAVFVLASEQERKFIAVCSEKGFDLRPLIKSDFDALGGRGGGGPSFFQGSFGTPEALNAFITACRKP